MPASPPRDNIIYKEDVGFEPTHAFTRLTVFKTVPFSRTWVILHMIRLILFYPFLLSYKTWTLQDSNLRPDGYEPSALTN